MNYGEPSQPKLETELFLHMLTFRQVDLLSVWLFVSWPFLLESAYSTCGSVSNHVPVFLEQGNEDAVAPVERLEDELRLGRRVFVEQPKVIVKPRLHAPICGCVLRCDFVFNKF